MPIIVVTTVTTIDTDKPLLDVYKAIEKGVYGGLDVKHVAAPHQVISIKSSLLYIKSV